MLGAILGDLAAWTWENDHEKFYPELISENAKLSDMGRVVLASFSLQSSCSPNDEWNAISGCVTKSMRDSNMFVREVNSDWEEFIGGTPRVIPPSVKATMNIVNSLVAGWFEHPHENAQKWEQRFHGGKEDAYFTQVADVIYKLRHGATKDEAIKDTNYIVNWNDHHDEPDFISPLFYACKAWKCFYYSFDYTSAIHNAARSVCRHHHLLAIITGAFAEAMYGCELLLLKEKYSRVSEHHLRIPTPVHEKSASQFNAIRQYEIRNRLFFPKNSALTNVERHRWTDIVNPWENYIVDEETYHAILIAFYPDWEHRHQLYLDNGWIYCCRSQVLLCRFQLKRQADGSYRISHLQKSEDRGRYMWGLPDALSNVGVRGIRFPHALDYCKYYQGELTNPYVEGSKDARLWYGEMMFCTTGQELEHWTDDAKSVRSKMNALEQKELSKFDDKELGIRLYIETLYGKFNPYDDFTWIYEY